MSYLAFAWIASVLYALEVIASKIISRYSLSNPWLFNFVWSFLIMVFTLPVAIFYGVSWPSNFVDLSLAGVFSALGGLFYILALYGLDVSAISPLFNFRAIISVILGFLLLGEVLNAAQLGLVGLIFLAGVLVTLDERWRLRSFFRPAVGLVFACLISLSLMGIFIQKSVAENGYWTTTAFSVVISQITLLLTLPKFWTALGELAWKNLLALALIAAAGTVGGLAANRAYAQNVGVSSVIISLPISMILAFIFSLFWPTLLEKHSLKVYLIRFSAAAVMLAAALGLSQI